MRKTGKGTGVVGLKQELHFEHAKFETSIRLLVEILSRLFPCIWNSGELLRPSAGDWNVKAEDWMRLSIQRRHRDAPGLSTLRAWDKENPAEKSEGKQLIKQERTWESLEPQKPTKQFNITPIKNINDLFLLTDNIILKPNSKA